MNIPEKQRKSRFIFSKLVHSTTDPERKSGDGHDQNIAGKMFSGIKDGLTESTTQLFSFGKSSLNFILPGNLFWDDCFCIMATTKSYVEYL